MYYTCMYVYIIVMLVYMYHAIHVAARIKVSCEVVISNY